jgi:uncharacterized protein HemY
MSLPVTYNCSLWDDRSVLIHHDNTALITTTYMFIVIVVVIFLCVVVSLRKVKSLTGKTTLG